MGPLLSSILVRSSVRRVSAGGALMPAPPRPPASISIHATPRPARRPRGGAERSPAGSADIVSGSLPIPCVAPKSAARSPAGAAVHPTCQVPRRGLVPGVAPSRAQRGGLRVVRTASAVRSCRAGGAAAVLMPLMAGKAGRSPGRLRIICRGRPACHTDEQVEEARLFLFRVRRGGSGQATCEASFVAVGFLAPLVTLLSLDAQRGDRARLQATQTDRLLGLLAEPVRTFLDAPERLVDL